MSATQLFWRPIDTIGCHLVGPSFVGGRTIEEVLKTGERFRRSGYGVTYNLLGEHFAERTQIDLTVQTLTDLISAMDNRNRGNVSVKPTQIGLQRSRGLFRKKAEEVVECGRRAGIETEFDAEQSHFIPDTCKIFSEFASQFCCKHFVRLAVQAGFTDIFNFMNIYELWDKQLRIVQGAGVYSEKKGIFIQNPREVIARYFFIAERNVRAGQRPYLATMRNRKITSEIPKHLPLARSKPMPWDYPCEIQMLYGPLGVELGEELLNAGWPVRMYIPFVVPWCKDEWKPYGMRRSAVIRRLFFEDPEVRRAILRECKKRLFSVAKK